MLAGLPVDRLVPAKVSARVWRNWTVRTLDAYAESTFRLSDEGAGECVILFGLEGSQFEAGCTPNPTQPGVASRILCIRWN